ncbi:MAG: RNA-binding S4 domain-containing protein [Pseudomonadota bacterium]
MKLTTQLRVDKFLFFTRFFKTRGLASEAVAGGHVTRAGERLKPSHPVRVGDELAITKDRYIFRIRVDQIPNRRGPAKEAQACYTESEDSIAARAMLADALKQDRLGMPSTPGRPDKHTRRRLRAFKDGQ